VSFFYRRYDGVIIELHRGTQCSSCGLRFKEANNENYRQHLDWHFRMNRKEKETVAAHRSWFITTDVSIYICIYVCIYKLKDFCNRDSSLKFILF
jgi:Fe-S-cluster-containing dehydrogenase component